MITLSPQQLNVLDSQVKEAFATKLTHTLIATYPALFTPLPVELAQRLVAAKISYAETRYQLRFQSALSTYLHYCCAIGARFDQQAEIQGLLDGVDYPDDMPNRLADKVSEQAWDEAEQSASFQDWLDSTALNLHDKVTARYCWALANTNDAIPTGPALGSFIRNSIRTAKQHHIVDESGCVAFAVCQTRLGKDFYSQQALPWVPIVFNDPEILPFLRGLTLAGCTELEWSLSL